MTPTDSDVRHSADERGVSPVIGVVMMVAVTVVLAAVIGTFVLDFGGRVGVTAPTASLAVEADAAANNVTLRHRGGDALRAVDTQLLVERANDSKTEFARYDATAAGSLAVGDVARISMGTASDGVDWPAGGTLEYTNDEDEFEGLFAGDRVTVTVIDTASDRVVFETTVRA